MRRAVWIPLVVLVLAIAGVVALVAWLATSEGAVVWLASRVAAAAGGSLEIVQPRGSFGGTVRIARLRYEDADFRVTASDVAVEPALVAVLTRRAVLRNLTARELEILVKPTPAKLPASLAVPLGVSVERLAIDRVVLRVDPAELVFTTVSLAYEFAEGAHAVRDLRATMALGALAGSGSLGAARPFPASATVSLARVDASPPFRVGAKLGGTLAQLELALDGEIAKASVDGSARIAPFAAERWLEDAALRVADLDLALLDASLPRTRIALDLQAASRDDGAVAGNLAARNAVPGPFTDNRLPLGAAASPFTWRDGALTLDKLAADLGAGGSAAGTARVARGRATLDLAVKRLDLRALHRPLRATRLDGTIAASLSESVQDVRAKLAQGRLRFEVEGARKGDAFTVKRLIAAAGGGMLTGEGVVALAGPRHFDARAKLAAFDPAAFGEYPTARINADIAAKGELEPHWRVEAQLDVRDSRWRAAPLTGGGHFTASASGVREADVMLRIGANRLAAQGALGRPEDSLAVSLVAPALAELDPHLGGRATVKSTLRGALARPAVEFDATAEQLAAGGYHAGAVVARGSLTPDADPRVEVDVTASALDAGRFKLTAAAAKASGSFARHIVDLTATGQDIDFAARLAGRWRGAEGWSGTVETLANRGRFPTKLVAPVALEVAPGRLRVGEATMELGEGRLRLARLNWERGRLATAGEFTGVAVARYLALAGFPPEVSSTLVVRGAWSLDTTPRLNGSISLARESGDVAVGDSPRLPLELTRLQLDARFVDDAVTGTGELAARRLGSVDAGFDIGRAPNAEPGMLSLDAPLAARATAAIASLRPLGVLLDGQALVDGALNASLAAGGTLRAPLVTGRLDGSGLALELPQHGVRLVKGVLAATLEADALRIERFEIHGGDGRFVASGTAPRAGDTQLTWQAEALRLFGLPTRRLTVDGAGKLAIVKGQLVLEGTLAAREGYFEFARGRGAVLDDDVVVVGRQAKPAPRGPRDRTPLRAALDLDFGSNFRVVGAGLDTGLTGKLHVATRDSGEPTGKGEIAAVHGLYFFLGQRLEIERGRLIFDGPLDNPALDVFAVRRGLAVEPGVQLTGTLRLPHVELVSRPPLPEGEKLAWLVLGRGLETASATDAILLQSAAASLLDDSNAIPISRRIALSMGLDDIGLKSTGTGTGTVQGQALTVGKRLSDRLYLTFEQGLAVARTIIGLEYVLGRGFRVRASGGQDSALGVFYTRSFD